jgi:S-(hydroxymethyl)glutathione dehydrogenase/alcohol dehydrogenase
LIKPIAKRVKHLKAAILTQQNSPLEVVSIDLPKLDVGHVLVKIDHSGICGKQVEEIDGKRGHDRFIPHLLGHEGAGTVTEVGPGVRKVKAGDKVVLHWMKGAGIDSTTPEFSRDGTPVNAGWVTTFSEYTVVSENRVTQIPDSLDTAVASLLGCAVTTGLGIVFNNLKLMPGQSIAVYGVGGLGINVIQGAALVNAYPIVAVDIHDHKLKQAIEFGATHTVNSTNTDPEAFIQELSQGKGFDGVVDVTGNNSVRQSAYDSTSNTGRTVFAGVPHHEDKINIDSFPLHFGRTIIGSHGGDTKPDVDIPRYVQLFELGRLKLTEQITHRFSLDEINQAVEVVRSGTAGRCIISMS